MIAQTDSAHKEWLERGALMPIGGELQGPPVQKSTMPRRLLYKHQVEAVLDLTLFVELLIRTLVRGFIYYRNGPRCSD
jgi:hypothetical protein